MKRACEIALGCGHFLFALVVSTPILGFEPPGPAPAAEQPRPADPWTELRDIFYVRRFAAGEVFDDPHASSPPWREYRQFVHDPAFHEQVVARLEAVHKLPPAQVEEQPAARRMILLRDLWPVFDGLRGAAVELEGDQAASAKAAQRRDHLLGRVARLMRRLELSDEQVAALPSALALVKEQKTYAAAFDPESPDTPFVPTDLLDPQGPWVAYSRGKRANAGGTFHIEHVQYRSVFTLHLRTPGGREEAAAFLRDFAKSGAPVPAGSTLALLRRALVPTHGGGLKPSPVVESLQLLVVTKEQDKRLKLILDRESFLARGPGLKLIRKEDPADHSSFESLVAAPRREPAARDPSLPAVEPPVLFHYTSVTKMVRSLETCAACHTTATRRNLFANFGAVEQAFVQPDLPASDATVVRSKEASEEWKLYRKLRDATP